MWEYSDFFSIFLLRYRASFLLPSLNAVEMLEIVVSILIMEGSKEEIASTPPEKCRVEVGIGLNNLLAVYADVASL